MPYLLPQFPYRKTSAAPFFIILSTLIFFTPNNSPGAENLRISPSDQTCEADSDCVIVSSNCSTCECGVPVNKKHQQNYIEAWKDLCRNYHGGVCEFYCSTPYPKCEKNRCILSALPNTTVQNQPETKIPYPIDSVEDGGYEGTAFCEVIGQPNFELRNHLLKIEGTGPFPVKLNEMKNTFSPFEFPHVQLVTHLRFENKENSYADTLYFGNDNNLYNCHGGK